LDKQEAAHQDAELLKVRKITVSKILVPPPDVSLEIVNQTQRSAAIQNPLSMLMGNFATNNNVPSLEEEMTVIFTPKMLKRQHLMNNDCGNAKNKFRDKATGFYSSLSSYVESKAKADNCSFLLQLLDKLERGVITQQQFEEMKASFLLFSFCK
jgi:hypothetical protein